jgi:hypothetical protein
MGVWKFAGMKFRSTIIALLKWLERMLDVWSRGKMGRDPRVNLLLPRGSPLLGMTFRFRCAAEIVF